MRDSQAAMSSKNAAADGEMKDHAWTAMERGDYRAAFVNFHALLPTDDTAILNALGWMRERGEGCSKDLDQAALFYRQSADAGSHYGLLGLGDVLNDCGKKDDAQAIYEKGALQGHAPSMWRLGKMLLEDERASDEKERGLSLLRDASDKANIFARRTLLGYEMRNAKSPVKKALIGIQILRLAISGIPRYVRDPLSAEVM